MSRELSVLDSAYAWRVVASYRVEDHRNLPGYYGAAPRDVSVRTVRWLAAKDAAQRSRQDAAA